MSADGLVERSSLRNGIGVSKWDARVKRGAERTSEQGMIVQFEWGSSELMEGLTNPEHVGMVGSGGSEPSCRISTEGCLGGNAFSIHINPLFSKGSMF